MSDNKKVCRIKDWLLYIEKGKTKAWDISDHVCTDELRTLCRETGIMVLGFVAFEYEKDAINYGEVAMRTD